MRGFKISILLLTVYILTQTLNHKPIQRLFQTNSNSICKMVLLSYLNYLNAHNAIRIKADVRLDYEKMITM
jgi:hypothetical protein